MTAPGEAMGREAPKRESYMREAVRLAEEGLRAGAGGPFGCVVVHTGPGGESEIVGRGNNRVTSSNDPTAHAEIVAIREACQALGTFELSDCELYTTCEPCPMCLAAVYWARIPRLYYANTRQDAAAIGFDDEQIYRELALPFEHRRLEMTPLLRDEAQAAFREWAAKTDKVRY